MVKTGELANLLNAELSGSPDVEVLTVRGVSDISEGCLTFLSRKKFLADVIHSNAAAVLVDQFYDELKDKAQLKVNNPDYVFAKTLEIFYPSSSVPGAIMEGADLAEDVTIGRDVTVYPNAYISKGAFIGDKTVIYPHVFIGENAKVGSGCVIYPHVTIREHVTIGNHVTVHANAVIGSDGFGYVFEGGIHYKIPQVGIVEIGDNVEIGAGVTIDRATTGSTVIGEGTKIDNLVQIGHNVRIGEHCILVAQIGIGGSTVIGDYVTLGGQVGVADHAEIESGVMVGAKSGIMGTLKKGVYSGVPVMPHRQWLKAQAVYERLPELMKLIKQLENKVKELEGKEDG